MAWICLCGSDLQYRRLLWRLLFANVFARESAMLKLPERGENEASLPNLPVLKIKDGGYNSTSLNKLSPDQNRPALQVNLVPPYELRLECRGGLGLHNESDRSRIIHRKK